MQVAGEHVTRDVTRTGGWFGVERRAVFPDHISNASFHVERIVESDTAEMSFGPLLRFGVPEPGRIVGLPFAFEAERRFGGRDYGRAALRGSFGTDRRPLKFAVVADASITEKGAPADVLPALGDERAMPGMRWGEERGRARIVGGFDIAYPIILGGHARIRGRAGAAPLVLRGFDSSHNWVVGLQWPRTITLRYSGGPGFLARVPEPPAVGYARRSQARAAFTGQNGILFAISGAY